VSRDFLSTKLLLPSQWLVATITVIIKRKLAISRAKDNLEKTFLASDDYFTRRVFWYQKRIGNKMGWVLVLRSAIVKDVYFQGYTLKGRFLLHDTIDSIQCVTKVPNLRIDGIFNEVTNWSLLY